MIAPHAGAGMQELLQSIRGNLLAGVANSKYAETALRICLNGSCEGRIKS